MNLFDKICAVIAIPIGIIMMMLGVVGLFVGSNAHFTLPPVLGGLPFFMGWAMSITLIRFWSATNKQNQGEQEPPAPDEYQRLSRRRYDLKHPQ